MFNIPKKLVTIHDRDRLWMNKFVKWKLPWKIEPHRIYINNDWTQLFCSIDYNGNRTHNQLVRKRTLTIWSNWLNDWVFVYELGGCGIKSHCSHLNFRYHVCFKQEAPWHSENYWVWIHSETRTWHDKNIQSFC